MNTYDSGDVVVLRARFGLNTTQLKAQSLAAATTITLYSVTGLAGSDTLVLNPGELTEETKVISSISGLVVTLSTALVHDHHVGESVWELADPTAVTLKVKNPAGTTTTYTYALTTVTRDSLGVFSKQVTLDSVGTWRSRWEATGAVIAAQEGALTVRRTEF